PSYLTTILTHLKLHNRLLSSVFFFSSRRRHTRSKRDWSSDVCSSDLCQASTASGASAPIQKARPMPWMNSAVRVSHCGEAVAARSEERRVGKECSSWIWADHSKREPEKSMMSEFHIYGA